MKALLTLSCILTINFLIAQTSPEIGWQRVMAEAAMII